MGPMKLISVMARHLPFEPRIWTALRWEISQCAAPRSPTWSAISTLMMAFFSGGWSVNDFFFMFHPSL